MSEPKKKASKTRNWCTILYPESCAGNWTEIVKSWKIQALASPVHDKDVTENGELKKPHIHLMMMFPGPKSASNVKELIAPLGAVGLEPVQSVSGMARYLCHLDNPDKAQYDMKYVGAFGGADYSVCISPSDGMEEIKVVCDIMQWCDDNACYSFAKLMRYARDERKDWLKTLCGPKHAVIYRYLRSCDWETGVKRSGD